MRKVQPRLLSYMYDDIFLRHESDEWGCKRRGGCKATVKRMSVVRRSRMHDSECKAILLRSNEHMQTGRQNTAVGSPYRLIYDSIQATHAVNYTSTRGAGLIKY